MRISTKDWEKIKTKMINAKSLLAEIEQVLEDCSDDSDTQDDNPYMLITAAKDELEEAFDNFHKGPGSGGYIVRT
jgi:hypothetical protein